MQLDKLELDLRPRSSAQALDLGFALLRKHAGNAYPAWLALWLPLVGLCAALAFWMPDKYWLFVLLAWWLRALPERAPLYVLSRRVFGEEVNWRQALKAWPAQLRGGWFSMLTWRRIFSPMRSLFAPIWQLEGARGKVAAERRRVIGRNGTYAAAAWFGIACFFFEIVLAFGLLAFIGIFLSNENAINPLTLIAHFFQDAVESRTSIALIFGAFAFSGSIIGPIFTACGFTLYLNRRATLEAWDLEIALRQIHAPVSKLGRQAGEHRVAALAIALAAGLLLALAWPPQAVNAADAAPAKPKCELPDSIKTREATRKPDLNPEQAGIRKEVGGIYDGDELRTYSCVERWTWKGLPDAKSDPESHFKPWNLSWLASGLQVVLIAATIALIAWLLYRYRDKFGGFGFTPAPRRATEIAGLDIRPESLPDDIPAEVLALWRRGLRREALALLYRATISRLVHDDGLQLSNGATEGDCTRAMERACRGGKLSAGRMEAGAVVTQFWLRGAYAGLWPDEGAVAHACGTWGAEFSAAPGKGQA
jgi:hypothetical protein